MAIFLKRVYASPAPSDGVRILVDRVWPRGMRKDMAAIDFWFKEIAPSTELRKWFGHDPVRWDEFCRRYRVELAGNPRLTELLSLAAQNRVTLIYAAKDAAHNHALALKHMLDARLGNLPGLPSAKPHAHATGMPAYPAPDRGPDHGR